MTVGCFRLENVKLVNFNARLLLLQAEREYWSGRKRISLLKSGEIYYFTTAGVGGKVGLCSVREEPVIAAPSEKRHDSSK